MERLSLNNTLSIKKVTKSFGGIKAVDNCSFDIEKGKITALVGPNGSGKSTIFNLITGNVLPDSGSIYLDNKNINQQSIAKRAIMGISRLYQQSQMFDNMSVANNLLLAIDKNPYCFIPWTINTTKQIESLAARLAEFGLKEIVNKKCHDLSFGQKRIVEIIRTHIFEHKIMLLDEPIAGIAPHLKIKIADFLKKLSVEGETILLIEHDISFIKNLADTVIFMDAGKIIARGNPHHVFTQEEVIKTYLG